MSYTDSIIENVIKKNPNEPEFIQAVTEVMNSLKLVVDNEPKYQDASLLERIVEPERVITVSYTHLPSERPDSQSALPAEKGIC